MKKLILILFILNLSNAFSCSCEETYKTPYADEIAEARVINLGLTPQKLEVIKYNPTLADKFMDRNTSCSGTLAGSPIHACTESFSGIYKVETKENCDLKIKVIRKKKSYRSSILENTCS